MKSMREAYIWAHLKVYDELCPEDMVKVLGISESQGAKDIMEFQETHGELDFDGARQVYTAPEGYSPDIDMTYVKTAVETLICLFVDDAGMFKIYKRQLNVMKHMQGIVEEVMTLNNGLSKRLELLIRDGP